MPKPIETRLAPWTDIILVCRKCSKKLSGGFGPDGDDALPRALKHTLRAAGRRSTRIIETKCLGLCPEGAVTVVAARTPGTMLVVPKGADPDAILAILPPPA